MMMTAMKTMMGRIVKRKRQSLSLKRFVSYGASLLCLMCVVCIGCKGTSEEQVAQRSQSNSGSQETHQVCIKTASLCGKLMCRWLVLEVLF